MFFCRSKYQRWKKHFVYLGSGEGGRGKVKVWGVGGGRRGRRGKRDGMVTHWDTAIHFFFNPLQLEKKTQNVLCVAYLQTTFPNWKILIEGWGTLEQFTSNLNGLGTRPPDKPQGARLRTYAAICALWNVFPFWKWIRPKRPCCSISLRKESGKGYWINAKKPLSRFNGKSCLPFPWDLKRGVDNLNSCRNVNGFDKDEDVQRGRKHFKSFEWS